MSRIDIDETFICEIWDAIKEDIPDKNKISVIKDILVTFEDYGVMSFVDLDELRAHDKYLKEAVSLVYKDIDEDEEDPDIDEEWD